MCTPMGFILHVRVPEGSCLADLSPGYNVGSCISSSERSLETADAIGRARRE